MRGLVSGSRLLANPADRTTLPADVGGPAEVVAAMRSEFLYDLHFPGWPACQSRVCVGSAGPRSAAARRHPTAAKGARLLLGMRCHLTSPHLVADAERKRPSAILLNLGPVRPPRRRHVEPVPRVARGTGAVIGVVTLLCGIELVLDWIGSNSFPLPSLRCCLAPSKPQRLYREMRAVQALPASRPKRGHDLDRTTFLRCRNSSSLISPRAYRSARVRSAELRACCFGDLR